MKACYKNMSRSRITGIHALIMHLFGMTSLLLWRFRGRSELTEQPKSPHLLRVICQTPSKHCGGSLLTCMSTKQFLKPTSPFQSHVHTLASSCFPAARPLHQQKIQKSRQEKSICFVPGQPSLQGEGFLAISPVATTCGHGLPCHLVLSQKLVGHGASHPQNI